MWAPEVLGRRASQDSQPEASEGRAGEVGCEMGPRDAVLQRRTLGGLLAEE